MFKTVFILTEVKPSGRTGAPGRARTGSEEALRKLTSLGLTHEASLGILRVLRRDEQRTATIDIDES